MNGKRTSAQVNTNTNTNSNNNNKHPQGKQKTPHYWSNVICYNYDGKGHKRESCFSASRRASAYISAEQKRNSEVVETNENGQ